LKHQKTSNESLFLHSSFDDESECGAWVERKSTGKLKYLRKNLSQNHCVQKKIPRRLTWIQNWAVAVDNLSYRMTFEYRTMYTEIQFILTYLLHGAESFLRS